MNSSSASNSIAQLIPRSPNDALDNISGLQIMFFLFYGGLNKTALLNHHRPPETKRATQNLRSISDISTAISIDICYYHSESVVFSRPGSRSSCRSPE